MKELKKPEIKLQSKMFMNHVDAILPMKMI